MSDLGEVATVTRTYRALVRQANEAEEARDATVFELLSRPATGADLDGHLEAVKQASGLSWVELRAIYRQQAWGDTKRGARTDEIYEAIQRRTEEVRADRKGTGQ